MKGVFWQALELGQPDFGQSPEAFNAIYVNLSSGKFIFLLFVWRRKGFHRPYQT